MYTHVCLSLSLSLSVSLYLSMSISLSLSLYPHLYLICVWDTPVAGYNIAGCFCRYIYFRTALEILFTVFRYVCM